MDQLLAKYLGLTDYSASMALQSRLHTRVVFRDIPDVLLFLEHPHVFTLGRNAQCKDVLVTPGQLSQLGVQVHRTGRGGQVTYHGPGQLVGYPIIDLRRWGGGPVKYVRLLEDVIVSTLAEFGISAGKDEKPTGVWVGDSKIAAIGVKVSKNVTTHGFSLNVAPDLSYYDHIVSCGMPGANVTSIACHKPDISDVNLVIPVLAYHFGQTFGRTLDWSSLKNLQA